MRHVPGKIAMLSVALAGGFVLAACERSTNSNTNVVAANTSANPSLTEPNPGLLLSVSPSKGPAAGGTEVKITGENFTGTPKLFFGTVEATSVKITSPTELTATAPAGTKGQKVDITLQAPSAPTSTLVEGFTYQ